MGWLSSESLTDCDQLFGSRHNGIEASQIARCEEQVKDSGERERQTLAGHSFFFFFFKYNFFFFVRSFGTNRIQSNPLVVSEDQVVHDRASIFSMTYVKANCQWFPFPNPPTAHILPINSGAQCLICFQSELVSDVGFCGLRRSKTAWPSLVFRTFRMFATWPPSHLSWCVIGLPGA